MKNDTKYDLTQEEYNTSLEKAAMKVFMNAHPVKNPRSFFIVAQPGAGKTGLRGYVTNLEQIDIEEIKVIEFNPDNISMQHKYYNETSIRHLS